MHGCVKAEGGKLYHALSAAANQIAELRAEHRHAAEFFRCLAVRSLIRAQFFPFVPRYVHSPLKRNVKELSLLAARLV